MQAGLNCYELPAPRRWNRFAISALLHAIALPLILHVAFSAPPLILQKATPHDTITWVAPLEPPIAPPPPRVLAELRKPVPLPPVVKEPEPLPVQPPKIEPPKVEPPKIEPPKVARVEPPKVVQPVPQFRAPEAPPTPKPPKREVAVAGFDQAGGSSAKPTVNKPASQVQTGGFGDPNGVRGQGDSKSNRVMIASLGTSFDLPQGPGEGNGIRGAKGVPGTVKDSGFGNGPAEGGRGPGSQSRRGVVASAGFAEPAVGPSSPSRSSTPAKPATTPVEIVSKPKPAYTAEARKQHIEGDVLLEVRFGSRGDVQVLRVVRGLGYGLDESAQQAARKISFKPATHDGQPADSTAMVHIVFQLAD